MRTITAIKYYWKLFEEIYIRYPQREKGRWPKPFQLLSACDQGLMLKHVMQSKKLEINAKEV